MHQDFGKPRRIRPESERCWPYSSHDVRAIVRQALLDSKDKPQSQSPIGRQQGYPGWEQVRSRLRKASSRHLVFPLGGLASWLMSFGGE